MSTLGTEAKWAGSVSVALFGVIAVSRWLRLHGTRTLSFASSHEPGAAGVARGERLLVVDDSRVNQRVVSGLLEAMGHRVDVASNGREAVTAVRDQAYAAVFMDCQMPEMDGFAATMEIRRAEGTTKRTPIIAMTASAMKADEERCVAAGMDGYTIKPVSPERLADVLSRWIAHPDAERGTLPQANRIGGTLPSRRATHAT